jgi:hypothetical protein
LLDVGAIRNHYPDEATAGRHGRWTARQREARASLAVTSIDLNAQDTDVLQADFFDFAAEALERGETFDVVVLSLVMNFVGSPARRGEMLTLCRRLLPPGGLLFVVLPSACLQNSRYMKFGRYVQILRSLGLPPADFAATQPAANNEGESGKPVVVSAANREQRKRERRERRSAVTAAPAMADATDCAVGGTRGFVRSKKLFFSVSRRSNDPADGALRMRHFPRKLSRGGKERNNFCIVVEDAKQAPGLE